ncbi:MFS transporter [Corallococcus sp. AS-1-6]|uniref:MFS transporter n=1 Tax=Corallococcus sp. AS-1-6 TaxID=2874599 RepID=UPI001CBABD3C|nr:MFS transporter [Corallococcus sp. AS-1-6]MBZ4371181.1 MFS transporter [Corallococcus sp. AS-1-6]
METSSAVLPAAVPQAAPMDRRLIWTMTTATVLAVGNVYYSQPLLGVIARTFGLSASAVGSVPMMSQLGYVAGLVLLTPLGDVLEKRGLLVTMLGLAAAALFAAGLAPTFPLFLFACVAIGLTSVLVQILIPFVAALSAPEERGRNLGVVLSAALVGVLISRTLSGLVATHLGWRGVYFAAGATMVGLAMTLRLGLPRYESSTRLTYPRLLQSLWTLLRDVPGLRAIALTGALMYAALSAFWASLAFFLSSDAYHQGPGTAGMFGLIGTVGALAANVTGRHAQRIGARRIVRACIVTMLAAFGVFAAFGTLWAGLIAGVVLLDLGAQAATVSNQTELYRLHPIAQTRLNTLYKMFYFVGGACGSALSAIAWDHAGWRGVCAVGGGFLLIAFVWEQVQARRTSG